MSLYNPLLVKKLKDILEQEPSSKSFCSLAQIYLSNGDLDESERICLEGLAHNPSYSQAYVILAEIHKKRGDMEKAISTLTKAQEFNPDNPNIYKNLGEIYRKQNDMEKTLSAYKMVSFLKPGDKTALSTVQHLEKVLGKTLLKSPLSKPTQKKDLSVTTLTEKNKQKLLKLNQILARVDNRISQREKEV